MKNIYWIKTTTAMKIILNRFHQPHRRLIAGLLIVLFFSGSSIFVAAASLGGQEEDLSGSIEAVTTGTNADIKTTTPLKVDKSAGRIVVGTVVSNETASVYSRREGIVQDVFVDIGDAVKQGQVIARLLPPGVEGQGPALINEKKALLRQSEVSAKNAESVALAAVEVAQRELEQKIVAYNNAIQKKGAFLSQAKTLAHTTKTNETARLATAEQELKNSRNRFKQVTDQMFGEVSHARLIVEKVLLGNRLKTTNNQVFYNQIPDNVGSYDRTLQGEVLAGVNDLLRGENSFSALSGEEKVSGISTLAQKAENLLRKTTKLLSASTTTEGMTGEDLVKLSDELNESHSKLLEQQAQLQDANNNVTAAEKKLVEATSEQEKNIEVTEKDLQVVQVSQDAELQELAAEIKAYQEKIKLLQAEQQQNVEREKASVEVAKAMFAQEVSVSGNADIRSPFSGTVSKRFISVGEVVGEGMPAFELVNVPTTLAKKAKREIQFGLPEDLNQVLKVGDDVEFFMPTDEKTLAQAKVTRKSPQVDSESRLFTVQAKLDDQLVIPHNTRVRIRIPVGTEEVYRIPSAVIQRKEDKNTLWVLNSDINEPQLLSISVINEDGEFAEVTGELSEKTKIVLHEPFSLSQPDLLKP